MLFSLELSSTETEGEINSFSMGHIILKGKKGNLSSKRTDTTQSMMIFISLSELLYGVRSFISDVGKKNYNFVGTGSSFQFFLFKEKDEIVLRATNGQEVDRLTQLELIKAIWEGTREFTLKYSQFLEEKEIVYKDLHDSIKEFKKQFSLDS